MTIESTLLLSTHQPGSTCLASCCTAPCSALPVHGDLHRHAAWVSYNVIRLIPYQCFDMSCIFCRECIAIFTNEHWSAPPMMQALRFVRFWHPFTLTSRKPVITALLLFSSAMLCCYHRLSKYGTAAETRKLCVGERGGGGGGLHLPGPKDQRR